MSDPTSKVDPSHKSSAELADQVIAQHEQYIDELESKIASLITDKTVGMDQLEQFDADGVPGPGTTAAMAFAKVKEQADTIERLQAERDRAGEEAEAMEAGVTDLVCELNDMRAERDAALLRLGRIKELADKGSFDAAWSLSSCQDILELCEDAQPPVSRETPECEHDFAQARNPRTGEYVLIDTLRGEVLTRSMAPHRGVPIVSSTVERQKND